MVGAAELVSPVSLRPGVGFALCYTPSISMVGVYFRRRKALAYGVAMSGSGIGTFVLAPLVQLLIEAYSWRGALLVLSAFVANLCVCGALLRPITVQEEEGEEPRPAGEEPLADLPLKPAPGLLAPGASPPAPRSRRGRGFLLSSQEFGFLLLPDFLCLAVSFLFLACGCSLPFVYLVPYALSAGVGPQHAAFLMSMLGVIGIVGNITFGWLTDRR